MNLVTFTKRDNLMTDLLKDQIKNFIKDGEWEIITQTPNPDTKEEIITYLRKESGIPGLIEWSKYMGALDVLSNEKQVTIIMRPGECGRIIGWQGEKIKQILKLLNVKIRVSVQPARLVQERTVVLRNNRIKIVVPRSRVDGNYYYGQAFLCPTSENFETISVGPDLTIEEFKFLESGPRLDNEKWKRKFELYKTMRKLGGFEAVRSSI